MYKQAFLIASILFAFQLNAQQQEPFSFKEVKNLPATPVKNQQKTGTCWCFSATSFIESELLREGKGEYDLSEMYVVRNIYRQKCENYIRRQGAAQFGQGGLAHDEINAIRAFGVMPQNVYPGKSSPDESLDHTQIEKNLKLLCADFAKRGREGKLVQDWQATLDRTLDDLFGVVPKTFKVNGKEYTPYTFRDFLGINPDDYVTITSFTHHPYWAPFVLEVPDNWANGMEYNLPLNEMMRCLNYSLDQGYTVEWDADVSNNGFSGDVGMAIVPEKEWKDKTAEQQGNMFNYWEKEKNITEAYRQEMFDKQETMDDHLMHITGSLDEIHTGLYYMVKNSWGTASKRNGYVYVSEAYMRLNTISFMVNKKGIPEDIRKRLGLEPGEVIIPKTNTTGSAPAQQNMDNDKLQNKSTKDQPAIKDTLKAAKAKPKQ